MYQSDRDKEARLGVADTQADASKYGADAQKESTIKSAEIGAKADMYGADSAKEASMYGADKTVDVANINVKGTIDNTRATGDETRKTQDNEQRLKAKDRANMHTYAKNQARNI